ncbi:hypothetical protein [Hymenobacter sp.]|uniref:hypothetical protein n=1 Tax=Hymenobacter sp. TaxID=1898978 RepID=UPI002EDB750D
MPLRTLFFLLLGALMVSGLLGRPADSRLYAAGLLLTLAASAFFPPRKPNQP